MEVSKENKNRFQILAHTDSLTGINNRYGFDEAAEKIGADPIRYLYAGAPVNNDVRFGFNLGDESRRKLLSFWNIYVFFNTYAVIDMPNLKDYNLNTNKLEKSDKWLLARINSFIVYASKTMSEY